MAYQTLLYPVPDHGRVISMDNFYTCHTLARQLNVLNDDEGKELGTVHFNNVDGINCPALKDANAAVIHTSCGAWHLVQVY